MGIEGKPQFTSKDGCIYVYNTAEKQWYKFCKTDVLPNEVKNQVRELMYSVDEQKDE
jgi:hypothetical protein